VLGAEGIASWSFINHKAVEFEKAHRHQASENVIDARVVPRKGGLVNGCVGRKACAVSLLGGHKEFRDLEASTSGIEFWGINWAAELFLMEENEPGRRGEMKRR